MLSDMLPASPREYPPNRLGAHSVFSPESVTAHPGRGVEADRPHQVVRQLGILAPLATDRPAVPLPVLGVLALRTPPQITQGIVDRIAVDVARLRPVGAGADEHLQDK